MQQHIADSFAAILDKLLPRKLSKFTEVILIREAKVPVN